MEFAVSGSLMLRALASDSPEELGAEQVYEQHADFVWRTLQHLGVRDADLEDLGQEVFVTVHAASVQLRRAQQAHDLVVRQSVCTWCSGIAAAPTFAWSFHTRSRPSASTRTRPKSATRVSEQARVRLERLLDKLSPRAARHVLAVRGRRRLVRRDRRADRGAGRHCLFAACTWRASRWQ